MLVVGSVQCCCIRIIFFCDMFCMVYGMLLVLQFDLWWFVKGIQLVWNVVGLLIIMVEVFSWFVVCRVILIFCVNMLVWNVVGSVLVCVIVLFSLVQWYIVIIGLNIFCVVICVLLGGLSSMVGCSVVLESCFLLVINCVLLCIVLLIYLVMWLVLCGWISGFILVV